MLANLLPSTLHWSDNGLASVTTGCITIQSENGTNPTSLNAEAMGSNPVETLYFFNWA